MATTDHEARRQWVRSALEQYERPLIGYARQIVGDLDVARDVVQETFLRLWQADQGAIEDHLAEWLFTVCRNRALDVRRKESRMQPMSEVDPRPSAAESPPEAIERRQSVHQLVEAMNALPENQREVVRLKFQSGLSYKQISEVTGLSVSNVGYLLHIGLKTLRSQMDSATSRRAS